MSEVVYRSGITRVRVLTLTLHTGFRYTNNLDYNVRYEKKKTHKTTSAIEDPGGDQSVEELYEGGGMGPTTVGVVCTR